MKPQLVSGVSKYLEDEYHEPEKKLKEKRKYKPRDKETKPEETEEAIKKSKHLENFHNIQKVLEYYYMCKPWTQDAEDLVESVAQDDFFLKSVMKALVDKDNVAPEMCVYLLKRHKPKIDRLDRLHKKVLSKIAWKEKKSGSGGLNKKVL